MKVSIDINPDLIEDEIIIKSKEINPILYHKIKDLIKTTPMIIFYQDNKECYLGLKEILFFETNGNHVIAHTKNDVYEVKYRLYELETLLPSNFQRIAKATIVNIDNIFGITKNIASASKIEFNNSHKEIYVSRHYYKLLAHKINERRNYER